jgi:hypothetical protein
MNVSTKGANKNKACLILIFCYPELDLKKRGNYFKASAISSQHIIIDRRVCSTERQIIKIIKTGRFSRKVKNGFIIQK